METIIKSSSVLTKDQTKDYGPRFYTEKGDLYKIIAHVRYDDECNNGHNSFAITGEISRKRVAGAYSVESFGCVHEEIEKHFPELAPYIKWHLTSSDGPLHYLANTIYHAGDRDCRGLLKGEFRQHTSRGKLQNNGVEGVPCWELKEPELKEVYSNTKPEPVTLEWIPYGTTGEGKIRELKFARSSAVWPEATDEELIAPGLKERLIARLPALMAEFKKDMEALGFVF